MSNAHASTTIQLLREADEQGIETAEDSIRELREEQGWYECHACGAWYQSENARVMCCSDGVGVRDGGDGR